MKFFKKLTAFLIVTSFIFSAEAFAKRQRREDGIGNTICVNRIPLTREIRKDRTATRNEISNTRNTQRHPRVIGTERSRTTAQPTRARTQINPNASPIRTRTAQLTRTRTQENPRTAQINTEERTRTTQPARTAVQTNHSAAPINARERARAPQLTSTRTQENPGATPINTGERTRTAQPITRRTQTTPSTAPISTREKTRIAQPTADKAPISVDDTRRIRVTSPISVTINADEFPADLKKNLQFIENLAGEELIDIEGGAESYTPQELREILTETQIAENLICGVTQKVREYYQSKGYGSNDKNITVTQSEFLNLFPKNVVRMAMPNLNRNMLNENISMSQSEVTDRLNYMQQFENHFKGITQRLREYFQSKGFQE